MPRAPSGFGPSVFLNYGARLTATVRAEMVDEVRRRVAFDQLQVDPRVALSTATWAALVERAAADADDEWLSRQLVGKLHPSIRTVTRPGRIVVKKVGADAAGLIASAEFNRLYAAAVCRLAIAAHGEEAVVRVFRGNSETQRIWRPGGSRAVRVSALQLLGELRRNQRVLVGMRSPKLGLSVELVQQ